MGVKEDLNYISDATLFYSEEENHKVEFCPKSEMGCLKITNKKIEIFFLVNSIGIQTPIF